MRRLVWVGICVTCLFSPHTLKADFIDALGVGARAMAMGSAYVSVSDDLSAIYYNPAGLAQIETHQLLVGYLWSDPSLEEHATADPSFHAEQVVPYHLKTPVVALGFNLDKAIKGKLPIHARIGVMNMMADNFKSIYRLWDPEPKTARWVRFGDYWDRVYLLGGLSLQPDKIPWISVGLGFRFIISGSMFMLDRYGTAGLDVVIEDLYLHTLTKANLDLNVDSEVTPTAGVMITPTKNLRLGYSFHNSLSLLVSPVYADAKARLVLNGNEGLVLELPLSLVSEGYYWPQQHNFGASYQWGEQLLLSLQLSWFRWSQFSSLSRGTPDPTWDDILVPRFGIEYCPLKALALRGGYFFEPSPVPEQTRVSNYIDNDRHVFSVGAGYTFSDPWHIVRQPMSIDIVFQYIHMPTRKTEKEDPMFEPGYSYESRGEVFSVGGNLTFRF